MLDCLNLMGGYVPGPLRRYFRPHSLPPPRELVPPPPPADCEEGRSQPRVFLSTPTGLSRASGRHADAAPSAKSSDSTDLQGSTSSAKSRTVVHLQRTGSIEI